MIKKIKSNIKFIDLGLPSGTLWGDRNLGANNVYNTGLYYAWGGLKGYNLKSLHKFSVNIISLLSKYNDKDNKLTLDPQDDVVTYYFGDKFKIPGIEDVLELKKYTKLKLENNNTTSTLGVWLTSKINDNKIFFPNTGYIDGEEEELIDYGGEELYGEVFINSYMWTDSRKEDLGVSSFGFFKRHKDYETRFDVFNADRYVGDCIRPVKKV